jgi:NADH dehydrogenase
MRARIHQPARSAMQSGSGRTQDWILEYMPAAPRELDPLMGWISSPDTEAQLRLRFPSRAAAEAYAKAHGIDAVTEAPRPRRPNIRPGGYAENFAPHRREAWTH